MQWYYQSNLKVDLRIEMCFVDNTSVFTNNI